MRKIISEQSLKDKIKVLAKRQQIDTAKFQTIVVFERVVARLLTRDFIRENMIFNGGFVMIKSYDSERFTKDLDAIIRNVPAKNLFKEVKTALTTDIGDGFQFWNIEEENLDMKSGYAGIRYKFHYKLGDPLPPDADFKHYSKLHFDVSIDTDKLMLPIQAQLTPSLSEHEPFSWSIYPPEYIIADKFHATFSRQGQSTRAKDIYDLSLLLPDVEDVPELMKAVDFIFTLLQTEIPKSFHAELSSYPTKALENVWLTAVEFRRPVSFKDSWSTVLEHLKRIDSVREDNR